MGASAVVPNQPRMPRRQMTDKQTVTKQTIPSRPKASAVVPNQPRMPRRQMTDKQTVTKQTISSRSKVSVMVPNHPNTPNAMKPQHFPKRSRTFLVSSSDVPRSFVRRTMLFLTMLLCFMTPVFASSRASTPKYEWTIELVSASKTTISARGDLYNTAFETFWNKDGTGLEKFRKRVKDVKGFELVLTLRKGEEQKLSKRSLNPGIEMELAPRGASERRKPEMIEVKVIRFQLDGWYYVWKTKTFNYIWKNSKRDITVETTTPMKYDMKWAELWK